MLYKDPSKLDEFSTQKKGCLSPIRFAMGLTLATLVAYLGLYVPFNSESTPGRGQPQIAMRQGPEGGVSFLNTDDTSEAVLVPLDDLEALWATLGSLEMPYKSDIQYGMGIDSNTGD